MPVRPASTEPLVLFSPFSSCCLCFALGLPNCVLYLQSILYSIIKIIFLRSNLIMLFLFNNLCYLLTDIKIKVKLHSRNTKPIAFCHWPNFPAQILFLSTWRNTCQSQNINITCTFCSWYVKCFPTPSPSQVRKLLRIIKTQLIVISSVWSSKTISFVCISGSQLWLLIISPGGVLLKNINAQPPPTVILTSLSRMNISIGMFQVFL